MSELAPDRFQIGTHQIHFRAPQELTLELVGPMSVEEAERLSDLILELTARHGALYVLVDSARIVSSGHRVRKVFAESDMFSKQLRAVAVWGAAFPLRIAINMVIKASSRLLPGSFQFPLEFFATEQQARAWMDSVRDGHLAEQGAQQRLQATGT